MIGQADSAIAKQIVSRYDELKSDRSQRSSEFDMISRIYRPQRQGFRSQSPKRSDWNLHNLFNSSTLTAASNATANLYSTICNPANTWFSITTPDEDLAKYRPVKEWHDIVSKRMHKSFRPAMSNFYSSAVTWAGDVVALGTGAMVSEEGLGRRRFSDRCISLADFVFGVDADGWPDEMIVEQHLTPVQAARMYGGENLPPKMAERAQEGKQDQKYLILQAIQPNDEYTPGRLGPKGRPFLSTHVAFDEKAVLRQRGYFEANFAIPRWDVDGAETYGRGLGYINLASGLKLQQMGRDNAQAGALAARPPIGTMGSKTIRNGAVLAPGRFLHGAISPQGQKLAQPITTFNGLPITQQMEAQTKEEVEQGWHAMLMTLANRTGMNNLEVLERVEERLRLQAPFMGRMQVEGLAPIIERRFAMLFRAGQIPPPPPELKNQPLDVEYTSAAALAHKAQEGVVTRRYLQDTYELAKFHPDPEAVWDKVDTDAAQEILLASGGVPERVQRSPEEIKKRRAARDQQRQAQAAMATASEGAGVAKDLSQADPAMLEGLMQ